MQFEGRPYFASVCVDGLWDIWPSKSCFWEELFFCIFWFFSNTHYFWYAHTLWSRNIFSNTHYFWYAHTLWPRNDQEGLFRDTVSRKHCLITKSRDLVKNIKHRYIGSFRCCTPFIDSKSADHAGKYPGGSLVPLETLAFWGAFPPETVGLTN